MEIPPRFSGQEPVHPGGAEQNYYQRAEGLAEDVRHYGQWMRDEAQRRIGHLYPKVTGPDGSEYTVIAWIWARTVRSPNPANPIETPLVRTWWLSKKKGHEAWIKATVRDGQVHYEVMHDANGPRGKDDGTRVGRGGVSVADGTPISADYIKEYGASHGFGAHLIAAVCEGGRGRVYVTATRGMVDAANVACPADVPDQDLAYDPRNLWTPAYGLTKFADLFTNRQLVALTTLSDLVGEARERVLADALAAGMPPGERLRDGGTGAQAYADAVATYLALGVSRSADYSSSLTSWNAGRDGLRNVFGRQAIPMVWDYAEANPFSSSSGNFLGQIGWIAKAVMHAPASAAGEALQVSAMDRAYDSLVISTDPPYYDNIGYSDLSDFFYVWLRRCLRDVHPEVVGTMLTPKAEELVANPYRHDGKEGAARFFVDGFNSVFARIRQGANPAVPMTVYYAYKQQDAAAGGTTSTGWHTLLAGLIDAGWEITATWPMRSERGGRMLSIGTNALASSIVLACRPRPADAPATNRRALTAQLKAELPGALRTLMQGAVAPVDLAQAAIGPGISVFSRYTRVREADGTNMTVSDALTLINATLDEVLGEQEADTDPDTRFASRWYRQYGWEQGSAGLADQLARSCDTSLGALERGGIFQARGGKARLLSPSELDGQWNPEADDRISIWEATVRLAAVMNKDGVERTAQLLAQAQSRISPDSIKELGFLLFHEAEKQHHTEDALLFNGLVTAWADITGKARRLAGAPTAIQDGFNMNGED